MRLRVEKVNVIVEQELPGGRTYPVVAMAMGKYKRDAIEMNVQNWSSEVSLDLACVAQCPELFCYLSISDDG